MTLHFLHGPTRSGKTTRLARWAAATPGATGLLMPDLPNGQGRGFRDLRSGFEWPALARPGELRPLAVGRFQFSPAAFFWANAALLGAATDPATRWLVLDEVGPLELRDEGLAPALRQVLARPAPPPHLLLVVRTGLLDKVREHFGLGRWPQRGFLF